MDAYKTVQDNTTVNSGIRSTPPKVLSGEIKRVNEVNTNELHQAIKEHDALSIILSQIDLIEQLQIEVERFHVFLRDRSQVLRFEIQNIIELYFDSLRTAYSHIKAFEQKGEVDSKLEYLNQIFLKNDREMKGKRALSQLYEEIVRPTQEKIVNEKLYVDSYWNKIAEHGKAFSHKYNELADLIEEFKTQYEVFYKMLSNAERTITNSLLDLNQLSNKGT